MPATRNDDKYSAKVGSIFLFNLIVGTGALALPGALQRAGWLVGIFLLVVLALFSFITVTFIVESLAVANAVSRKQYGESSSAEADRQRLIEDDDDDDDGYSIAEKYEIAQMAVLLCPKWCQVIIYTSLCLYLFGDLAIYAVVFGKTWANVLCARNLNKTTLEISDTVLCFESSTLSTMSIYRISIFFFIALIGPFTFFNLQKTKLLQIFTVLLRVVAFTIMLVWSITKLLIDGQEGNPQSLNIVALPALFGAVVYSFMCQHSIPGLLQPIRDKKYVKFLIPLDFSVITVFYIALGLTAIFAFKEVNDLYSIEFWEETEDQDTSNSLIIISYFLALFPIFTTGTNYPILAITLKNNFRALILKETPKTWYIDQFLLPLLVIIPPTALALCTSNLSLLVGIIGSYCGSCVQYLIPCLLVTYARLQTLDNPNTYSSAFKSKIWIILVYIWMIISLIFITINFFKSYI